MKWDDFIKIARDLPVIDSEVFFTGKHDSSAIKVQLCRWQKSGKLIHLKRGLYLLSENYRKIDAYELYIASILKQPSYVSLEKALEFHGMIPEGVSVYTSITTKRPERIVSKIGVFDYRHIKNSLFWGYKSITVNKQTGFIASPEKALLDFLYLKGMRISMSYLEELRLQNLEKINIRVLHEYSKRFQKPGILNAAKIIEQYINSYTHEEKSL